MRISNGITCVLVCVFLSSMAGARAAEAKKPAGPVKTPAWLAGKPLNVWFPIEGTKGAGGAAVDAYSGMTLKEITSEIFIACAGGHNDSNDNRVVSLDLRLDAPAWVVRKQPSAERTQNTPYYPDGTPSSRHTYASTQYVESLDRVMLFGLRFTWPGCHQYSTVDGFDPVKNEWDKAGTHAKVPQEGDFGVVKNSITGDVWTGSLKKWSAATKTWSDPITKRAPNGVRFPYAFDSKRNQLFGLNFGDGQGYGDKVINSIRVPVEGKESIQITFKDSDAVKQFIKDEPTYCGMDYDPDNDRFLFYAGQGAGAGRVFVIKPNETNVWEMSLYAFGPGSATPPDSGGAGINNRFRYVPQLKGFVLLARGGENLYFLRTAEAPKK